MQPPPLRLLSEATKKRLHSIKDGFFQLYYQDEVVPGRTGATGPGQQVAVARAPVADVVSFARQRKVAPWFKYYQGAWKQPALGGGTFTPLNLPVQGYMHVRRPAFTNTSVSLTKSSPSH